MIDEKFVRYWDNPTLDRAGLSPVATEIEQLKGLDLDSRRKIVASIEILESFSSKLKNDLLDIVSEMGEKSDSIRDEVEETLKRVKTEISTSINSLDIPVLWLGLQIIDIELEWARIDWKNPTEVLIYQQTSGGEYNSDNLVATVKSPRSSIILDNEILKNGSFFFAVARDITTGMKGKPSEILEIPSSEIRERKFLEYLRGKITESEFSKDLLDSIYSNFRDSTDTIVQEKLSKANEAVEKLRNEIQSVISELRGTSEQSWSQLRAEASRLGDSISSVTREAEGLREKLDRTTTVAENAIAAQERILTSISEKESAINRNIENKIAEVNGSLANERRERESQATSYNSRFKQIEDTNVRYNETISRNTAEISQVADSTEALRRRVETTETEIAGNKANINTLEKAQTSLSQSLSEKLSDMKSSFNSEHFYNYDMKGGRDGWHTDNVNDSLIPEINPSVTGDNQNHPRYVKVHSLSNPTLFKSTETRPLERDHSYTLSGAFRSDSDLVSVRLALIPFDKTGNAANSLAGRLKNYQGGNEYPVVAKQDNIKANQWINLSGKIHQWAGSYPISNVTEADMIPPNAVYGCPALIIEGKSQSYIVDISKLDIQDETVGDKFTAELTEYKQTIADELKQQSLRFDNQISGRDGLNSRLSQLSETVTEDKRQTATRLNDLSSKSNEALAGIQRLDQTITSDRSANTLAVNTLRADFSKPKSNVITDPEFRNPLTGKVYASPESKYRVIPKAEAFSLQQNLVLQSPQENYLKIWADEFRLTESLEVNEGDEVYIAYQAFTNIANVRVWVSYRTQDGDTQIEAKNLGVIPDNTSQFPVISFKHRISNPEAKKVQFFLTTDSRTRDESTYVLLANPALRIYNEDAIKSDSQINSLKILVSSAGQAYTAKTDQIQAELNGRLSTNNIERTARAQADEVASQKIEQLSSRLSESIRAGIQRSDSTISDATRAMTASLETAKSELNSRLGNFEIRTKSDIANLTQTVNDQNQALATRAERLESSFRTIDGKIGTAISEERARSEASTNRIVAEKTSELRAAIQNVNASIQETKSIAIDTKGKVDGKIGLKINANGKVVGYESTINGNYNDFSINADNFKISNSINNYTPFRIDTSSGQIEFLGKVRFSQLTDVNIGGANLLNFTDTLGTNGDGLWVFGKAPNETQDKLEPLDEGGKGIYHFRLKKVVTNSWANWRQAAKSGTRASDSNCSKSLAKLEFGRTYTVSLKACQWTDSPGDGSFNIILRQHNKAGHWINSVFHPVTVTSGKTYSSFSHTFTLTERVQGEFNNFEFIVEKSTVGEVFIKEIKLEEGSIATAWSPAPEDSELRAERQTTSLANSLNNLSPQNIQNIVRNTTDIDGGNIKTGTLVANKIVSSPGNNLIFNSVFNNRKSNYDLGQQFVKGSEGSPEILGWNWWARENLNDSLMIGVIGKGDHDWGAGDSQGWNNWVACIHMQGNFTNNETWRGWLYQVVDVVPGKEYIMSAYGGVHRCTGLLVVENYDYSGYHYRSFNKIVECTSRYTKWGSNNGGFSNKNDKGRFWVKFTAPATGKVCIAFTLRTVTSETNSNPYFFFTRPMLEEARPGQTEPSTWEGGPAGMINDRGEVFANSLSAISADMGDITAGNLRIGNSKKDTFWMERGTTILNDGVIRTNAIEIRSNRSTWGVDPININGKFVVTPDGNVTARDGNFSGHITATGGSISGWLVMGDNSNGVILKGNERRIDVLENNVVKVRLGQL